MIDRAPACQPKNDIREIDACGLNGIGPRADVGRKLVPRGVKSRADFFQFIRSEGRIGNEKASFHGYPHPGQEARGDLMIRPRIVIAPQTADAAGSRDLPSPPRQLARWGVSDTSECWPKAFRGGLDSDIPNTHSSSPEPHDKMAKRRRGKSASAGRRP